MITLVALAVTSVTAAAVARAVRRPRHRPATPAALAGAVLTGFRYCPAEFRTRAAVLHPDGTASCADCGAHIPARSEDPYKQRLSVPYGLSTGDSALTGRQADHQPTPHTRTARIGGEEQ